MNLEFVKILFIYCGILILCFLLGIIQRGRNIFGLTNKAFLKDKMTDVDCCDGKDKRNHDLRRRFKKLLSVNFDEFYQYFRFRS